MHKVLQQMVFSLQPNPLAEDHFVALIAVNIVSNHLFQN